MNDNSNGRQRNRTASSGNRSGRNNGGKSNSNNKNNSNNSGRGAQKRSNKRRRKNTAKAARDFWGDPSKLPTEQVRVGVTTTPGAVPSSLGQPPLTGQESAAQHYFDAVYTRAVVMAGALAAASDLVETLDD